MRQSVQSYSVDDGWFLMWIQCWAENNQKTFLNRILEITKSNLLSDALTLPSWNDSNFPQVVWISSNFTRKLICLISICFTAPFLRCRLSTWGIAGKLLNGFKICFHFFSMFPEQVWHLSERFYRIKNNTVMLEETTEFPILSSLPSVSPLCLKYSDLIINLLHSRRRWNGC